MIRKRKKEPEGYSAAPIDDEKNAGDGEDKAQLHSETISRPQYELEGEISPELRSELPALEPVGSEMADHKRSL